MELHLKQYFTPFPKLPSCFQIKWCRIKAHHNNHNIKKTLFKWWPIDFDKKKKNCVSWTCKAIMHIGKCDQICVSDYIYLMVFCLVDFSWSGLWKVMQCMSLLSRFFFFFGKTEWQHWAIFTEFVQSCRKSLWSKYFVHATHFRSGHFNASSLHIYFNT